MIPFGDTCFQLEATFIDVKNMYLHKDSNPGLWTTVPMQVAPEGVLP